MLYDIGASLAASPELVLAYLDPGSGSMILQILLGGIAGAVVAVKLFWHRIAAVFKTASADPDDHSSG